MRRTLLRWLLRELSTDDEDMIGLIRALPGADDEDAQALLEELAAPRVEASVAPIRAEYQHGSQLLAPLDASRTLSISRSSFYALIKRGTFPPPVQIDDVWIGWPRDLLLEWADTCEPARVATSPQSGYAPFERSLWRNSS